MNLFSKNYKVGLVVLSIIFIALSIILHLNENYFWYRLVRGIFCGIILIFLLMVQGKNVQKWIVGFLIFNGASCITMAWFEDKLMASATMVLAFISYMMFFFYIIPKVKISHFTKTFSLLFILLLLFNGYLFIQFIEAMRDLTLSETQHNFTLISGITGSLLGFFALYQNHIFNTQQSMTFMFVVIMLIFSGIFRGIGYYDLIVGNIFVYLSRILYVLALSVLFHLSVLDLKTKTIKIL